MRHKAQEWRIIMKKKTLALTMAMALVLSLAACGNSNADVATESTAAATTEAATEVATTEAATEATEAVADEKSEGVMTYEEYMAADLFLYGIGSFTNIFRKGICSIKCISDIVNIFCRKIRYSSI